MTLDGTFAQAKRELGNIAVDMLDACVMINAVKSTAHYREHALYTIRSYRIPNVFWRIIVWMPA